MSTSRRERSILVAKVLSSISATTISLACGTNYAYSAWGPQFAYKLKLSSTEQNLIGTAANFGMYSLGIPIGMGVDANGARFTVIYGAALLGIGYIMLYNAYCSGHAYIPLSCLVSFFTGVGGCASFAAAVKVSVLNWPHHRGTATAFPVAAFGLSAFFFSTFGQFIVAGDTAKFLLLLAIGTPGLILVGFFCLKVVEHPESPRDASAPGSGPQVEQLHSRRLDESRLESQQALLERDIEPTGSAAEESEALIAKPIPLGVEPDPEQPIKDYDTAVPTRGIKLLALTQFWQLFTLMGILAGTSLMTINNIGNNVKALWKYADSTKDEDFIIRQQALQVSIISIASFGGRILSGIGSDILVKTLNASRLWCLVLASIIFLIAQLFAISNQDPNYLVYVSVPNGLAYGFLFGCFPSLVAEAFGIGSLSQNFGAMTIGPIVSGNLFNLFYGIIYDQHSKPTSDGHQECTEGLSCYQQAYYITSLACILGLVISLWSISYTRRAKQCRIGLINSNES